MKNNELVNLRSTSRIRIAEGIWGRFLLLQNDRIEFVIIMDDGVLNKHYRKAWVEIDETRIYLRHLQGTDMKISNSTLVSLANRIKWELLNLKDTKYSYLKIAKSINLDLIIHLLRLSDENENDEKKTDVRWVILTLFHIINVKIDEGEDWINEGLDVIKQGKAPWSLETGPIYSWKVRDTIRQWRKDISSGKVDYKEELIDSVIDQFRLKAFQDGYYQHAVKLLKKTFPDSYEKNKELINDHIEGMKSSMEKLV